MATQEYPIQGSYPPVGTVPPVVDANPAEGATDASDEKKGFFSGLKEEAEKMGQRIEHGLDAAKMVISEELQKHGPHVIDHFQTGNVVHLISRVTGGAVQIVMNPEQQLVLDANGPLEPDTFNTMWTVVNEGDNQVRLHNNDNYIAIVDGQVVVKNFPEGTEQGPETLFKLSEIHRQFVALESVSEKPLHMGFLPTGQVKVDSTDDKEPNAQFRVAILSSSQPQDDK